MSAFANPVICIGETLIDLIVADGAGRLQDAGLFAIRDGGAPANAAVALARLGVRTAFCGVIGADPFGERLRARLEREGIDVSRLRSTADDETTLALAWKDARGDGHFRLLRMADRLLSEADIAAAGIRRSAAIVIGSVALSAEPSRQAVTRAAAIASDARVPVIFDVNMRPTLWRSMDGAMDACRPIFERATLLKLSLDDGRALFADVDDVEDLFAALEVFPARHLVITDGERGAWFLDREESGRPSFVPRFEVAAIEPTGAGDAFLGACVARWSDSGWQVLTLADIQFAAAAGALATTKPGAMDALPTRAEVDAFLTSRAAANP